MLIHALTIELTTALTTTLTTATTSSLTTAVTDLFDGLLAATIGPAVTAHTGGATGAVPGLPMIQDVCAKAPAGVQPYVEDVLGWVKYGVIALIIGAGFASVGALVVGKLGSMGRAAQVGASGLFWTVIGAIAFVTIYGILNAIVGNGC